MCLILIKEKPNLKIPRHVIEDAMWANPDGFGIVFLDTMKCVKTMSNTKAEKLLKSNRPFVAHLRYATVGKVCRANCHPFEINEGSYLFANGTVAHLGDTVTTDAEVVASMLDRVPKKYWGDMLSMTRCRFAVAEKGEVTRYGKWHKYKGVWYSKDDYLPGVKKKFGMGFTPVPLPGEKIRDDLDPRLTEVGPPPSTDPYYWEDEIGSGTGSDYYPSEVCGDSVEECPETSIGWMGHHIIAVYGTLKQGEGNHHFLFDSEYLGRAVSNYNYHLRVHGLPYLHHTPKSGKVELEVYKVSNARTRECIDSLEGHPDYYCREIIPVTMEDGTVLDAWVYFSPGDAKEPSIRHRENFQSGRKYLEKILDPS